jgi:hypothetical protein
MWTRFFTIADYAEEEQWLREQHRKGWALVNVTPPCFYTFAACEPEDVIYRLDYKNKELDSEYKQLLADFGWEYAGQCVGWFYFRKPAAEIDTEQEGELFSDDASRLEMIEQILRTRMLPILVIFFCCVLPQLKRSIDGADGIGFLILWLILLVVYLFILLHCGKKLLRLKRKYKDGE